MLPLPCYPRIKDLPADSTGRQSLVSYLAVQDGVAGIQAPAERMDSASGRPGGAVSDLDAPEIIYSRDSIRFGLRRGGDL